MSMARPISLPCEPCTELRGVYFPLQYDHTVGVLDGSTIDLVLSSRGENIKDARIAVNLYDEATNEVHRVMDVHFFLRNRDHIVPCICVVNEDDDTVLSYDIVSDTVSRGLSVASLAHVHLYESEWRLSHRMVRVPPEDHAARESMRTNIRCDLVSAASVMERDTGYVTMQVGGEFEGTITDVHDVRGGSIFRRGIDAVFTRLPSTYIPIGAVDDVLDRRTPISLEMGRASLEPLFLGCGFANAFIAPAFMERSMNLDFLLEDTPNVMHSFFDVRTKRVDCSALIAVKSLTTRKPSLAFSNCQSASYIVMRSQRGVLVDAHVRYLVPEYDNGTSIVSIL